MYHKLRKKYWKTSSILMIAMFFLVYIQPLVAFYASHEGTVAYWDGQVEIASWLLCHYTHANIHTKILGPSGEWNFI